MGTRTLGIYFGVRLASVFNVFLQLFLHVLIIYHFLNTTFLQIIKTPELLRMDSFSIGQREEFIIVEFNGCDFDLSW